jgi:hypothetical protein
MPKLKRSHGKTVSVRVTCCSRPSLLNQRVSRVYSGHEIVGLKNFQANVISSQEKWIKAEPLRKIYAVVRKP